jgi:aquaporin TIP
VCHSHTQRASPSATMSGNIAFGRFDDSFSAASIKAYVAEFISTLLFVFAGVGSAIAYSKSL